MFRSASSEWNKTFCQIKDTHDRAYNTIERAIKFEEQDRPDLAMHDYKEGIKLIDEALAIPVEVPPDFQKDENWAKACSMINKMKGSRREVVLRVGQLAEKNVQSVESGIEAFENEPQKRPRTYVELTQSLKDLEHTQLSGNELELLFSCDGVKMYYIYPTGEVSSHNDSYTLRIVRIEKDDERKLESSAFVQVIKTAESVRIENVEMPIEEEGAAALNPSENDISVSFIYPLVPGISPCYRTDFGAFILPDLQSENGGAIGLMLPAGPDEVVTEIFVAFLHGIVHQEGAMIFGEPKPRVRRSTSITVSENIIKGAFFVSKGLVKGAEKAGEYISYGTPYLMSKMQKAPEDGQVPVSKNMKTGIEVAKNVTATAANVTGYVAEKVGVATMAFGRFLAPHIQKHGSNLLTYSMGLSHDEASEQVNGVLTICAGAVEGFGTVYKGLETSASILGKSLSNNTVKIVDHKYGSQAGQAVESGLDTVGNVINVSQNVNCITPKGFVKRTAKNAGKALVQDYRPIIPEIDEQPQPIYPDLSGFAREVAKKDGI